MTKKQNVQITSDEGDIVVSIRYYDEDKKKPGKRELVRFASIADARQFAYELLEATMDFVINNNSKQQ